MFGVSIDGNCGRNQQAVVLAEQGGAHAKWEKCDWMEYAALTFWLLVIVFSAMGVHRLWSSLIRPKIVNSVLLPGTLVAQLGHILGLLVTGGTVNDTALVKDDDSGEPQTAPEVQTRIPLVGPIVIALLPLAGCVLAIYGVAAYFDSPIVGEISAAASAREIVLPTSFTLFFATLRQMLNLVESLLHAIVSADLASWQTALFLYLVICLTVRMAPLTGNLKGALGAIFLFGIIAFVVGKLFHATPGLLASTWPLITFCVAVSLLLLIVSLMIKGIVALAQTLLSSG